jgi:2-oxoglutarate ferredoxin oxidoreductase subunit delta
MIAFNEDLCKGCDLCAWVCPKDILSLDHTRVNSKGYNPMVCTNQDACISCGVCNWICPDSVITVKKGA